jgi:hypothetical protein
MASRYSLSQALIDEYKTALTGAMSLTTLFGQLKDETETRTVTQVTRGIVTLGESLREFSVIVTRDYEETIQKVTDKSAGLLDGFKLMAQKARDFAANLRTLRDMGLSGDLFNQLVAAGVEAGGQTAQALVDGGADTVNEISSIFDEINTLGADLGEEVATTLYGTGLELGDGLIAGILAKQEDLEQAARDMAQAFNDEFSALLSTQIAAVTDGKIAKATADAAQQVADIPIPDVPKPIDTESLNEIMRLIEGAKSFVTSVSGGNGPAGTLAGALSKQAIYEAIAADIASGQKVNISGIESGLSAGELLTRAQGSGSSTVQNITINVKTDATQSTAMVGQTLGSVITSYAQNGGKVLTR